MDIFTIAHLWSYGKGEMWGGKKKATIPPGSWLGGLFPIQGSVIGLVVAVSQAVAMDIAYAQVLRIVGKNIVGIVVGDFLERGAPI